MQIGNPQFGGGGGGFGGNNETSRNATALLPGRYSVLNVTGYAVSTGTITQCKLMNLLSIELLIPPLLQFVIDNGIRPHDITAILQGTSVMIIATVLSAITTLGQGFVQARLSQAIAFDMRNDWDRSLSSIFLG